MMTLLIEDVSEKEQINEHILAYYENFFNQYKDASVSWKVHVSHIWQCHVKCINKFLFSNQYGHLDHN